MCLCRFDISSFFFFNDTATTEIYTLSLHDALPIFLHIPGAPAVEDAHGGAAADGVSGPGAGVRGGPGAGRLPAPAAGLRSEEHTSELQSRQYLVCRLLLEKKKKQATTQHQLYLLTH